MKKGYNNQFKPLIKDPFQQHNNNMVNSGTFAKRSFNSNSGSDNGGRGVTNNNSTWNGKKKRSGKGSKDLSWGRK